MTHALITLYIDNLPDTGTAPMGTGSDDRAPGVRAPRHAAIRRPYRYRPTGPARHTRHFSQVNRVSRAFRKIPADAHQPLQRRRPDQDGPVAPRFIQPVPDGKRSFAQELYEGALRWQSPATNRATGRRERQVIRSQARRDLRFTDGGTQPDAPLLRPMRRLPADTLRPPAMSVTIAASG